MKNVFELNQLFQKLHILLCSKSEVPAKKKNDVVEKKIDAKSVQKNFQFENNYKITHPKKKKKFLINFKLILINSTD